MNTSTAKTLPVQPLTAIKGFKHNPQQLQLYIQAAWLSMYTALWNGVVFSTTEKELAQNFIKDWLLQKPDVEAAYKELVQRVLLTRSYLIEHPGKYVTTPSEWLHPSNTYGFKGTERWLNKVQALRASMPLHCLELKAFAEAVLEMEEEPSGRNFHYWRSWFAEREHQDLLNLFLSVVGWSLMGER